MLGVLGAIDPHSVKMHDFKKSTGRAGGAAGGGGQGGGGGAVLGGAGGLEKWKGASAPDDGLPGPSTDDYYPTVTVGSLCVELVEFAKFVKSVLCWLLSRRRRVRGAIFSLFSVAPRWSDCGLARPGP